MQKTTNPEDETLVVMEMDRLSRVLSASAEHSMPRLLKMHGDIMMLMAQRLAQLSASMAGMPSDFHTSKDRLTMEILILHAILKSGRWPKHEAINLTGTIVETILNPEA